MAKKPSFAFNHKKQTNDLDQGPVDWSGLDPEAKAYGLAPGCHAVCGQCMYFNKLPSPFGDGSSCSVMDKLANSPVCSFFEPELKDETSAVALAVLNESSPQELLALSLRLSKLAKAKLASDTSTNVEVGGLVLVRYTVADGIYASDYRLGIVTFKDRSKVGLRVWVNAPPPSGNYNLEATLALQGSIPFTKVNGRLEDIVPMKKWGQYLEAFENQGTLNRPGSPVLVSGNLAILAKSKVSSKSAKKVLVSQARFPQLGELAVYTDRLCKVVSINEYSIRVQVFDLIVTDQVKLTDLVSLSSRKTINLVDIEGVDLDMLTPIEHLSLDKRPFNPTSGLAPHNLPYDLLKKRASIKEDWERKKAKPTLHEEEEEDILLKDLGIFEEVPILEEDEIPLLEEDEDNNDDDVLLEELFE